MTSLIASLLSTTIILSSTLSATAAVVSPFTFYGLIGDAPFLNENPEASGLALAPDSTHLAGVTDSGRIFFLNLDDYTSGHCSVGNNFITPNNFEGIAIDTTEWSSTGDKYAYLIHEGSSTTEPYLHKIKYTYDSSNGSCSVTLVKSTTLFGALPCFDTSNGIESLSYKETINGVAVFSTGVQDAGLMYEITSEGKSNGECGYDNGLGGISGESYDNYGRIWSIDSKQNRIAVIDPSQDGCTLAIYDIPVDQNNFPVDTAFPLDKEGLAFDFTNELMYMAVDDGPSSPSVIAAYNFTYPEELSISSPTCIASGGIFSQACNSFTTCSCDKFLTSKNACDGHPSSCGWEGKGKKGQCITTVTAPTTDSPTSNPTLPSPTNNPTTPSPTNNPTTPPPVLNNCVNVGGAEAGTSCNDDESCCSDNCKGKRGDMTCK